MNLIEATEDEPGRREKRKLEVRNRIQIAAYSLFQANGIKETSIEQICSEADVARRTFYSYYPDKQVLLSELGRNRAFSNAREMIRSIMSEHGTATHRLSAIIDFIESNLAQYTEIDRKLILVMPASIEGDHSMRAVSDRVQHHLSVVFREGIANGDLADRFSPSILSEMVMGTLNNIMVSWALNPQFPIFKKLEEARDLFNAMLAIDSN